MGKTVRHEDEKIHFDLDGSHEDLIRAYDFDEGEFNEVTVDSIRKRYSRSFQRQFFAEVLRYGQGTFSRDGDSIVYELDGTPLGAVFDIADKQENENGEVVNVNLNTIGSITYRGNRILNIEHSTNRKLFSHFVNAMNNRVETADLF